MRVRRLERDDLENVIELWHETRKHVHTQMGFAAEEGVTLEDSRRIFRDQVVPSCQLWVAGREDQILGFMAIRGAYLDRMYVRLKCQRSGVGTALLEKARELSPSGLELHTHQGNRGARAFYEKHGFRAVRFGVSPPPENEPDVEYRWSPD